MARGATILNFEIDLSDVDRGVYEQLELKVAQHPSESAPYLVTRVLAYALEYQEGIAFTEGLSSGDVPAVWVRDLTDQLMAWVDVGTPDSARLHKASKAASRVAVYCHKETHGWLNGLAGERVYEAETIALFALPWRPIRDLGERLERRNRWSLSRMEDTIYLEISGQSWEVPITRLSWPTA